MLPVDLLKDLLSQKFSDGEQGADLPRSGSSGTA